MRELEQFTGQLLEEIGQPDLQYPFEKIIEALNHER
jgi:hypothetical protein